MKLDAGKNHRHIEILPRLNIYWWEEGYLVIDFSWILWWICLKIEKKETT